MPLRNKWVTFTIEVNRHASNTWTWLSLENCRRFYDAGPGLCAMRLNLCVSRLQLGSLKKKSVDDEFVATPEDEEFWEPDDYITGFFVNQLHLEVGIARNDAITENTVALFVGMCIRTATFFVSKTSKSLFLSLNLLRSDGCS